MALPFPSRLWPNGSLRRSENASKAFREFFHGAVWFVGADVWRVVFMRFCRHTVATFHLAGLR